MDVNWVQRVKRPASCLPSMAKKYGHPMDHWFKRVKTQKGLKHIEPVNWL
ncbi:MAG: DUF4287 domain-containing protein [Betaproteobacteria bacterium]|nr:DUF4287 domain-containing protein [Betaproteobacteria bacterium]NBY04846.1 DUF4287 domain-containing protein [Betaproteobacteria bacterium]